MGPHGDFLPLGSGFIEEGRATFSPSQAAFHALFAGYGYPAGTVPYQRKFGFNSDGTLFTQGNFEDPHHANLSLDALQYVGRRMGATPTLFVGTYRTTAVDRRRPLLGMLASFRGDPRFVSLELANLEMEASTGSSSRR